jgi:hypothetical protein
MTDTKKSLFIPLLIILAISLAANVYSFSKPDEKGAEAADPAVQYEKELLEKERTIETLQQELETAKAPAPAASENETTTAPTNPEAGTSDILNTAQRFVEYAFETDPETYVTRKKMAKNYMTSSLFETLYPSDGVDEEQQKVAVDIKEINVFMDGDSGNEAIVHYVYKEEILASGYEEEKEMYVKLSFAVEDEQLKVAEIEPLENDYGGI